MPDLSSGSQSKTQAKRNFVLGLFTTTRTAPNTKAVSGSVDGVDHAVDLDNNQGSRPPSWKRSQNKEPPESQPTMQRSTSSSTASVLSRSSSISQSVRSSWAQSNFSQSVRNSWSQSSNPDMQTNTVQPSRVGYTPKRAKSGFLMSATPLADRKGA